MRLDQTGLAGEGLVVAHFGKGERGQGVVTLSICLYLGIVLSSG